MTSTSLRRPVLALATALVLGAALGGCTNTIQGLEKDSRQIFGTQGGSPSSDRNPSETNAKGGAWKNPE